MRQDVAKKITDEELWFEYAQTKSVEIRNDLVKKYSYLAKYIATKTTGGFQHFSHFEDVIHEGVIALVDAVEKFDLSKNIKFETFASIKIKGAIIDYIRKLDLFPRRMKKNAKILNQSISDFIQNKGHVPSNEELAEYMSITINALEKIQMETHALQMLSFEEIAYENNVRNISMQTLNHSPIVGPEAEIEQDELKTVLAQSISSLKKNEQIVVSLYYKEGLKIKEIAEVLNISSSRVSQIHSGALQKLKVVMKDYMQA